jgi:hypothetical protein
MSIAAMAHGYHGVGGHVERRDMHHEGHAEGTANMSEVLGISGSTECYIISLTQDRVPG